MADCSTYHGGCEETIARDQVKDGIFAKKSPLISIWPYRIVRIILSVTFLWSGITKLFDPTSFSVIIESYGVVPESWVSPVAIILPTLEVIAGIGLLIDIRGSLAIITSLLILFLIILGYGIYIGLDIDCGCFGPGDPDVESYQDLRPAIYRDFMMMAGVFYLYLWRYLRSAEPVRLFRKIKTFSKWRNGK